MVLFFRIDSIKFSFYFGANYKQGVVEEYNPVNVTFLIVMSLENELYNSLAIDIDMTATFIRIIVDSWTRKTTTIIDTVVVALLGLSSFTYFLSILKTSRLVKVCSVCVCITCGNECVHVCMHACACVCMCVRVHV